MARSRARLRNPTRIRLDRRRSPCRPTRSRTRSWSTGRWSAPRPSASPCYAIGRGRSATVNSVWARRSWLGLSR